MFKKRKNYKRINDLVNNATNIYCKLIKDAAFTGCIYSFDKIKMLYFDGLVSYSNYKEAKERIKQILKNQNSKEIEI